MTLRRFAVSLATLFGVGHSPICPGTLGAFLGTLFYVVAIRDMGAYPAVFLAIFLILIAVVVCGIAEKEIGENDPSCVILDEFVAMPICFFGVHAPAFIRDGNLLVIAIGFTLFRFFDIVKPFWIAESQHLFDEFGTGRRSQHICDTVGLGIFFGGIGIVIDDIIAAFYTNIVLSLVCSFISWSKH